MNYDKGGYPQTARNLLTEALDYSYQMKDSRAPTAGLHALSANAFDLGELVVAEYYARRSLAHALEFSGKNDPDTYKPLWWLGHTLVFAGKTEEAVPVLLKAIRLNPYPPSQYFHNLAFSYHQLEKYEEAIAEAKKAIRVSPKDIIAHRALVSCYSLLGQKEEARAAAEEVLRIDPDFSVDRYAKTIPFKNRDKLKELITSYRMAGLK